jgi:phosphoesterase RecJ-like protein
MTYAPATFFKAAIIESPEGVAMMAAIRGAASLLLTTHEGPDGDGIGAQLALARALRRMGKRVHVINPGDTLRRFRWMDRDDDIRTWRKDLAPIVREVDLAILVDTNELRRAGAVGEALESREGPTLAIDHHSPNGHAIPGLIGSDFSSTGELMVHVLDALGTDLTPDLADLLYTAILFDTNQFRFLRNDPEVLRIAARLVEAGADAETIGRRLFGTVSKDSMLLMGRVLSSATFELDGRLAWSSVTQQTTHGLRVDRDEVRSMVNVLSDIEDVEIAVLFKTFQESSVKISLRSRGRITVGDIAEKLGGGGHPMAAGADIPGPLEDAVEKTLVLLREKLGSEVVRGP